MAGEHEDAGADDDADAEEDEVDRTEGALQSMPSLIKGLDRQLGKGLL